MKWTHGEEGPTCFCGQPTHIMVGEEGGEVNLLCFAHTQFAGALFPVPRDKRPDTWPNLTDDEMIVLVNEGYADQDTQEGKVIEIGETKKVKATNQLN